jgi:hypothetical protein
MLALAKDPAERPTAAEFGRLFGEAAADAGAPLRPAAHKPIPVDELPTLEYGDRETPPARRKPQG